MIFEIHGNPVPQQQTRFSCKGGFPKTWDPSKKDKERIQWQIKPYAPVEPIGGAIKLFIKFFLPIPKSVSKMMRTAMANHVVLPCVKPDVDNLAYLVTNALKKIVYKDDNQIVYQSVSKVYDLNPRTVIEVIPVLQTQEVGLHESDI